MKKLLYTLLAVVFIVSLAGCAAMGIGKGTAKETVAAPSTPNTKVVMGTPMVKMDKKAQAVIMGAGFQPGQEVSLLFTDVDGVQADIGYALKPEPKANKIGAWVTTWSCGRYVAKKLIKEGAYVITVTDSDYNVIDTTPVSFYQAKAKKEKKK